MDSQSECKDSSYPLVTAQEVTNDGTKKFKIAVISDLDKGSKHHHEDDTWVSILKYGTLSLSKEQDRADVEFQHDTPVVLKSGIADKKGRGMELSELKVFNGQLYTVDDRTGIVYAIKEDQVEEWVKLVDGDGTGSKGFKGEWMTEKEGRLYIGSLGKEWTSDTGEILNTNHQWVKVISKDGTIEHVHWNNQFTALRKKAGCEFPGYLIHEAIVWSSVHKKWFVIPRRASTEAYDPDKDEKRGTNIMLVANEDFTDIEEKRIGEVNPVRGFSSFKFVPGTNHTVIVALKSEEVEDKMASYLLVFDIDGKIICEDQLVGNQKYEGIEFV